MSISSLYFAQSKRSLINDGVELYKNNKFSDAEVNFKKGLEKDAELFQGHFNLGDAYYKQGRYDEAIQSFKNSLTLTENKNDRAKIYHNIGNSFLKSQKFPESIEAYKNSLKLNPDDLETKYNLSYALNMMKQDQNKQQQQQNKDNKDQNKDQQQQQNQNQNDQNKNQDKQNKNQQKQQQPKNEISKNDAERILEALKNNERDLQKKLRQNKGQPVVREKDW
jgi:tetratricopeptide (TPR) repeat protein